MCYVHTGKNKDSNPSIVECNSLAYRCHTGLWCQHCSYTLSSDEIQMYCFLCQLLPFQHWLTVGKRSNKMLCCMNKLLFIRCCLQDLFCCMLSTGIFTLIQNLCPHCVYRANHYFCFLQQFSLSVDLRYFQSLVLEPPLVVPVHYEFQAIMKLKPSGNFLESMRVTLVKTRSNRGHRVWTGHLLYQGKVSSVGPGLHYVELLTEEFLWVSLNNEGWC